MRRYRSVLLLLAVVFATAAVVLAVSGGFRFTVGGFRVSARSPIPAAVAALAAAAWWWHLARRERTAAADLEAAWLAVERHSTRLVGILALISAIVASAFATRSAAGADASGYLSQAAAWRSGFPPVHVEPLAREFPALDGWMSTPLGWRPRCAAGCAGEQAPTYPPGLPLLFALPHAAAGIDGATAVIAASAAVSVWAAGLIAGGVGGVLAAALLAFAPVFIYQSVQPMSDVPVTAAWATGLLLLVHRRPAWLAGFACGVAVLVRPNLAPLAVVPLLMAERRVQFAVPVAMAGVFLAVVNAVVYGSPLRSGYGSAAELFALGNIGPNAVRYGTWLVATAPMLALAPLGFARSRQERYASALALFCLLVVAAYLIYGVFEHWSYLRFLLPALAVLAVFSGLELAAWIERWPRSWRMPIFLALALGVTGYNLHAARSLDSFKLADRLRRVEQVADVIIGERGTRAVVIAGEQSGALRYYTALPIVRWEAAAPETMRDAIAAMEGAGYSAYVALDVWEVEPFTTKFSNVPEAQLDWPALVEAGTSHRTKAWRIADRARFRAGERVETSRIP